MLKTEKENLLRDDRSARGAARLSYCRPRVIHREVLEAIAAACAPPGGKAFAIGQECNTQIQS